MAKARHLLTTLEKKNKVEINNQKMDLSSNHVEASGGRTLGSKAIGKWYKVQRPDSFDNFAGKILKGKADFFRTFRTDFHYF